MSETSDLVFRPMRPALWDDLVDLFGPERGANSGCWCMWWRLKAREWKEHSRVERRDAFRRVVESGDPTGVLAYADGRAVGWCAVGPRDTLPRFNASRVAHPAGDTAGIWAINCFFVRSGWRKHGLMAALIGAAVDYARSAGARAVEACPVEPRRVLIWTEGFVGIRSVFAAAGFATVEQRTPIRALMRLDLAE